MEEIRKTRKSGNQYIYSERPVIKVAMKKQNIFIVSKLVVERLKMNVDTQALMFGLTNKKFSVKVEPKEDDNYHLSKADTSTFRFRNMELYKFVSEFYKSDNGNHFFIEMQEDFTFKKL